MKKLLLLSCFVFAMSYANGQHQQDLIENSWYIDHVIIDNVTYDSPIVNFPPPISKNIEFLVSKTYAVLDPESDSFFSDVIYDPVDLKFTFPFPAITLPGCNQFCDFAIVYFGFLFGDGEDVVFTYEILITDSGSLFLILTDEAGNQAFYQDTPILGLDDLVAQKFKLFPSPASDILYITSEGQAVKNIVIYDITGQQLSIYTEDLESINVSQLPSGIYFATLQTEVGKVTKKFIKN